ncbi:MAG TPA: [FeFe] hydrogenase H-cluster radical SAM maturase HydE, partial [Bacteroidales bacterium]|nr:[FeFe] hydrogenase H-cluster radical SAM maturase HydE [Bacteroidales bacterium]
MFDIIDKLAVQHTLSHEEFRELIENRTPVVDEYLFAKAREIREKYYGKEVYLRGLIEISNYCRNNCFYCGIRNGNREASRYRMSKAD